MASRRRKKAGFSAAGFVLVVIVGLMATYPLASAHVRRSALRPLGEWNSVEVVSKGGEVRVSLNGELVTTVTKHEFEEPGHIGFQSEGAEVYLRNIRIQEH